MIEWITSLDFSILDLIQQVFGSSLFDKVMPLFTHLADAGIFWIVLTVMLLADKKNRKEAVVAAVALLIDVLICNVLLKPLVARIRPYEIRPYMELIISRPHDFSFPSGHAAASFAVVSALYLCKNKMWIPGLVLAALIGFSRLYLYVHYPTDVLAGVLIGCLAGYMGWILYKGFTTKQRRT